MIEVGANIGAHTFFLAKRVGDSGHVYAFEPTNYAFSRISANLGINPSLRDRISLYPNILTNKNIEVPFENIKSSWTIGSTINSDKSLVLSGGGATNIDSFSYDKVDLLKIDVDGFDFKVLQGSEETIKRHRPKIYIELCQYTLSEQGNSLKDVFEFLGNFGYVCTLPNGLRVTFDEVLHIVGNNSSVNGIFEVT